MSTLLLAKLVLLAAAPAIPVPAAGAALKAPVHAMQVKRLLITNAMVIYGGGNLPFRSVDIPAEDECELA